MSIDTFSARVAEHIALTQYTHWVQIELIQPNLIDFVAGQYVMLKIPSSERTKNYSIASPPAVNHQVDLLVDIKPQGEGTKYITGLKPGDEVEFMAPGGRFVITDNQQEKQLVFVATGSGISAIRSMILNLLQTKNDTRQINLHWGIRFVDDIYWEEDFRLLAKQFSNFSFDLVLSKGPEDWPLCSGHVTDCLKKHYQDFENSGYYLCGNRNMIEETSELLTSKGVDNQFIHHEQFY